MTHLRRIIPIALVTGAFAALSGCTGGFGYTATATTSTYKPAGYYAETHVQPTMVPVSENVWVVENRPHPVFFSAGAYWRYDSGNWYRSSYVDDGYVQVRTVPSHLNRINRPTRYIRYRAPQRAGVRVVPRSDIRGTVQVRRPGQPSYDADRQRRDRDRYERRDQRDRGDRYDRRDRRDRR
jgi:hypothetical protein